ncbi:unnamed protein product [Rotaria sp. Silwood2]|nr:unnamed protein product [Rotaria sp. Silwood2]CAF3083385.1 unnamed protein product [Rotaria sp. Silwood2]CAF3426395.1 unnamed protein product [Rotaria sp. Silwood2]CAF4267594.1 unnamed protein product [Rotaria sp. Silwood2]CAF4416335.1 unnamed protein product [Rotaria sp. Silwood2]
MEEKKEFRSFVLQLKQFNPSWEAKDITNFLVQSENPPSYTTKNGLRLKIWRILKRNQVNDLPRSGAPRTTATNEYIQSVKLNLQLTKNASIRNVNRKLQQQGFNTSRTSVWRVKESLNLKWWKKETVQKLTTNQKLQRVFVAKQLRRKYGVRKEGKLYDWVYVLDTDFSGTFTLTPQSNKHNEGVYAEFKYDIPYELKTRSKEKFKKSVMLWGGISYQGLFPKGSPIFVDEWLNLVRPENSNRQKKMYFTGERYAKFIQSIVAEKANKEFDDLHVIFQDDQDRKQRMQVALNAVNHVFPNRIEPKDCAAKLADVWPIENVWGILKEKLQGQQYNNIEHLKTVIKNEWNQISVSLCRRMIDKIPQRLKLIIDEGGNQIQTY